LRALAVHGQQTLHSALANMQAVLVAFHMLACRHNALQMCHRGVTQSAQLIHSARDRVNKSSSSLLGLTVGYRSVMNVFWNSLLP
jgi:hypothetical protein